MKYKIGDKVEIKTWEEMEDNYGSNTFGILPPSFDDNGFINSMERDLNINFLDRILVIKTAGQHFYTMEGLGWLWDDYMIKGLVGDDEQKMLDNEQKTFRDFFGRDIKVEDKVLHLWATVSYQGVSGGTSAIKHKTATVIGFSKKGVRIEWKEKNSVPLKRSTIFNTRNRLIILRKADLGIDEEIIKNEAIKEYEAYKKGMLTRIRNLREELKYKGEHIRSLIAEKHKQDKIIIGLTDEIKKVKSSIYRFEIMDFDD